MLKTISFEGAEIGKHRNINCPYYDNCLTKAVAAKWKDFSCLECGYYTKQKEIEDMEDKDSKQLARPLRLAASHGGEAVGSKQCKKPGCHRPVKAKGLCRRCYDKQWRRDRREQERLEESRPANKKKPTPVLVNKKADPVKGNRIDLRFDDEYKNLFYELEKTAKKEFRTIDLQILYLIDKGLRQESENLRS